MEKNIQIKRCLDENLADVVVTEQMHRDIVNNIMGGRKMKKKLTVGFAMAIVLSLVIATALAAIAIIIRADMQKVLQMEEQGVFERWETEDKIKFIGLMEQFGLEMDSEKLAILKANTGTEEALDQIAGEIINAVYEERIRSRLEDWVDQPEAYLVPDYFTIFEDLWLRNEPDASEAEILAAYETWHAEAVEPLWVPITPEREREIAEMEEARNASVRTEAEMLEQFDSYLSEVLSFSRNERRAATVSIRFLDDLQLWEVTLTIRAQDARPNTLEQLTGFFNAPYDEEQAAYTMPFYYLPNG
ncbi:MAG: hypothetical protein FWF47_03520, partial [Clostridia bacterium]|nr:hypothetical protein [Clostridia bacterium]